MSSRNRSEGWQYAKITGHSNEEKIANLTLNNKSIQDRLLSCMHLSNINITNVKYGGLTDKNVPCIFDGETTKSKTDMWIELSNNKSIKVSIKPANKSQVFLL